MTGLTLLILALYPLAIARLTRLINSDRITDPIRLAAARHTGGEDSWLSYLLACPWCISLWLGLLTAPFTVALVGLPWYVFPFLALATSHLVGLAAALDGDDVEIIVEP